MDFNLQNPPEGANDSTDTQADNGNLAPTIGELVAADGGLQSQAPAAANEESDRLAASQSKSESSLSAENGNEPSEPKSPTNSIAHCRSANSLPAVDHRPSAPSLQSASSRLPAAENYNLRNPAVKRLLREAQEMSREPNHDIRAIPLEDNLFEWHFTIRGPADSEFSEGVYHGRIIMPPDYPLKPPAIMMLTPSGRFETGVKICLSISSYHPETWRPSWSIRTALMALISFMATPSPGAIGSLECSPEVRRRLARQSVAWVCPTCGPIIDDVGHRTVPESAPHGPVPAQRVFRIPHEHDTPQQLQDSDVVVEGPSVVPGILPMEPVPNDGAGDRELPQIPDEDEDEEEEEDIIANIPLPADETAYHLCIGALVFTIVALAIRRIYWFGFEF